MTNIFLPHSETIALRDALLHWRRKLERRYGRVWPATLINHAEALWYL